MIQLLHGDCLELMKQIPDGSVDMILCDPPYGMDFRSNRRVMRDKFDKIKNDKTLDWLDGFVDECFRVMRDDTAAYIFCSWHQIDVFKKAIERKFKIKNVIVWVKNNHGSGDLQAGYAPKHEFVIYANKGRCKFRDGRKPDVMFFDKIPSAKLNHPTEKNTDMLASFIRNSTDVGAVVVDPFMGSGTTGLAAAGESRNFIGIELDDGYFEIARKRIEEAQQTQAA